MQENCFQKRGRLKQKRQETWSMIFFMHRMCTEVGIDVENTVGVRKLFVQKYKPIKIKI
jgi:hypothetical protein